MGFHAPRPRADEDEIDRAVALYRKHKSCYKVGELMGRSDQCIWGWMTTRGEIAPKKEFSEQVKRAALRRLKTESIAVVAADIGCCQTTLKRWRDAEAGKSRKRYGDSVHLRRKRRERMAAARAVRRR